MAPLNFSTASVFQERPPLRQQASLNVFYKDWISDGGEDMVVDLIANAVARRPLPSYTIEIALTDMRVTAATFWELRGIEEERLCKELEVIVRHDRGAARIDRHHSTVVLTSRRPMAGRLELEVEVIA